MRKTQKVTGLRLAINDKCVAPKANRSSESRVDRPRILQGEDFAPVVSPLPTVPMRSTVNHLLQREVPSEERRVPRNPGAERLPSRHVSQGLVPGKAIYRDTR